MTSQKRNWRGLSPAAMVLEPDTQRLIAELRTQPGNRLPGPSGEYTGNNQVTVVFPGQGVEVILPKKWLQHYRQCRVLSQGDTRHSLMIHRALHSIAQVLRTPTAAGSVLVVYVRNGHLA